MIRRGHFAALVLAGCASVPGAITAERARTPKGMATVVEFVDFECSHCRVVHDVLAPILAKRAGQTRVVLKHVPLVDIHPSAASAARAAVCAEASGKGDEMADALFHATLDQLNAAGTTELAARLGLDGAEFAACLADPKTRARIDGDTALFDALGIPGVPTLWIGDEKLEGEQPAAVYEAAVDRAIQKARSSGM